LDGLSVHHQKLETLYTATAYGQTAAATCCSW